jgi:hypothetical protein
MSIAMRAGAGSPLPVDAERWWRVAAEFSLAVADAIEDAAGMQIGTVGLKWPNDLVVRNIEGGVTQSFRKVGGVLAEAGDAGSGDAWASRSGSRIHSAGSRPSWAPHWRVRTRGSRPLT